MKIESLHRDFESIITPDSQIALIAEGFSFTEGPVWDSTQNRLLFSDIPANKIFSWSKRNGLTIYREPSNFSNGLAYHPNGNLIACEHQSRAITSEDNSQKVKILVDSYKKKKLNSPNDVTVARDGSILFTDPIYGLRPGLGGPAEQELFFQGVFRLPPGGKELLLITESFERPNGLVLSPDERYLFIGDTVQQHIRRFEIGHNWKISGGEIWAELWDDAYTGRPDGMKVDTNGNLFCTGPGGIWVFNTNSDLIGRIYLPEKTSNLNWGNKNCDSLYITSSSCIYMIQTKTSG